MAHKRDLYTRLVYTRANPIFGRIAYFTLKLLGIEIPNSVIIGNDFELTHGGFGVVIHPNSVVGNRVKMYPGVTLGRADVHLPIERSGFDSIVIEDDVILASGAKVLCKSGTLAQILSCSPLQVRMKSGRGFRQRELVNVKVLVKYWIKRIYRIA
jgi:serine O-acetyltransferase